MSQKDDKTADAVSTDDKTSPPDTVELQEGELDQAVGGRKSGGGQQIFRQHEFQNAL